MATTAKQTIGEIDYVELLEPVAKDGALTRDPGQQRGIGQWPAGARGTVVTDLGEQKMVEISDDRGVALDFVTVPVEHLRLISKHAR